MGRAITTWETRVREMLGNPTASTLPNADLDDAIAGAVRRASADIPRTTYSDYNGDGSTFDLPIPAAWVNGFSVIKWIEYPTGNRPATLLDDQESVLYPDTSAPTAIRLNLTTPAAGSTARVGFTVPWPIPTSNAAVDLIADPDFDPICHLAAYLSALELAGKGSQTTRNILPGADLAGFETEENRWVAVADKHRREYLTHVGGGDENGPASAIVDWDAVSDLPEIGRGYLFRRRRR